jgi:AraC-like DNA-binding protein
VNSSSQRDQKKNGQGQGEGMGVMVSQLRSIARAPRNRLAQRASVLRHGAHITRTEFRTLRATKAVQELEQVLSKSPHIEINLRRFAEMMNLEKTYCCKVFRATTGKSFCAWVREIRIEHAQALLRLPKASITDVAHAVGYSDVTTFARNFRRVTGLSPRRFRQIHSHAQLR